MGDAQFGDLAEARRATDMQREARAAAEEREAVRRAVEDREMRGLREAARMAAESAGDVSRQIAPLRTDMTTVLEGMHLSKHVLANTVRFPDLAAFAAPPGLTFVARALADVDRQRVLIDQIVGMGPSLRAVRALGSMTHLPTMRAMGPFATPTLKALGAQIAPGLATSRVAASVFGPYHAAGLAVAYAPFRSAFAEMALPDIARPTYPEVGSILRSLAPTLDRATLAGLNAEFSSLSAVARQASVLQTVVSGMVASQRQVEGLANVRDFAGATRLARSLDRLSVSVGRVWEDFAARPDLLPTLPSAIREAPTLQLYTAARGAALVLTDPASGTSADEDAAAVTALIDPAADEATETWLRTGGDLAARLEAVGAGLGEAYAGAVEALQARRADYARHTAISLRELLDALLGKLAPDDDVCGWYTPTPDVPLRDGPSRKLTRAARIAFLYRGVAPAFARFVRDERNLIQQTFYALNDGTHGMPVPLTAAEVEWLMARVRGHLHTLLSITGR